MTPLIVVLQLLCSQGFSRQEYQSGLPCPPTGDRPNPGIEPRSPRSRDITLSTKVHLVKAMVFPVVMYGCENWTIKKAELEALMVLNCGVGEDS